jgi:hypothetical protein
MNARLFSATRLLVLSAFALSTACCVWGQQEHVIDNFRVASGGLPQGISPASKLVGDGKGNFFGTTYFGGPHYCGFESLMSRLAARCLSYLPPPLAAGLRPSSTISGPPPATALFRKPS